MAKFTQSTTFNPSLANILQACTGGEQTHLSSIQKEVHMTVIQGSILYPENGFG